MTDPVAGPTQAMIEAGQMELTRWMADDFSMWISPKKRDAIAAVYRVMEKVRLAEESNVLGRERRAIEELGDGSEEE